MDNINNRSVALPITGWMLGPCDPCPGPYVWLYNLVADLLLGKPWKTLNRCNKQESKK